MNSLKEMIMIFPRLVKAQLHLLLVVNGAPNNWIPVLAEFSYESTDPYAVRIEFFNSGEYERVEGDVKTTENVKWVFARQLLIEGLEQGVGDGDVRVQPMPRSDVVFMTVASPSGLAQFRIDKKELVKFLNRTMDIVIPGQESGAVDIDAELAKLDWG
jgi:hypothetical protein